MLSFLNATNPAPAKASKANTITARRLRQNAIMDLSMLGLYCLCESLSVGRWGVEDVADENGPVRHGHISALQAFKNLVLSVLLQANLDDSLHKRLAIRGDPGREGAIAISHHAIHRYGDRFHWIPNLNREVGEHSGAQLVFGIGNITAHHDSVRVRINGRAQPGNLAVKRLVRIGHHFRRERLAHMEQ